MANRNTTLNLPESLIAKTKTYAAAHGTSMTAIIREHLEAVTDEVEVPESDPLQAYAAGLLSRRVAIRDAGVRDYAELLVALGDAGLTPPWPPEHEIENQAAMFVRIWNAA